MSLESNIGDNLKTFFGKGFNKLGDSMGIQSGLGMTNIFNQISGGSRASGPSGGHQRYKRQVMPFQIVNNTNIISKNQQKKPVRNFWEWSFFDLKLIPGELDCRRKLKRSCVKTRPTILDHWKEVL